MSELTYGINVENLLYELSQHDSAEVGEFEICGEDTSGREGCASIDITLLAADALTLINSLREQLAHKDAALNTVRADAICSALDACSIRYDTDCVMDAYSISYASAELGAACAKDLHDDLVAYASNLRTNDTTDTDKESN
ncbi:hypothetical protein [Pantoea ananatis]|uniref:hypothetical protein n=1 Tax=Pantoea ananas TaxID=553 RepID=UPI001B3115AB|nr:hypothetical protein [Pantoea ananatis]